MTPLTPIAIQEAIRTHAAGGRDAVARWAGGPFLLEVRLEDPAAQAPGAATSASRAATVEYDEELLLDLRRVRASDDAALYPLAPGVVAGRAGECGLRLDGGAVTSRHARFERRPDGTWTVADLGSTNGTFVQRDRLEPEAPRALEPFTRVQLGERRFVFLALDDLVALLSPVDRPQGLTLAALQAELEALGSRRFSLRHEGSYLLVDGGERAERGEFAPERAFALAGPGPLRIGRSRALEVPVPSKPVSKLHARLTRQPGSEAWWLEDAGSSYGTTRNGERLAPEQSVRLAPWDSLCLGGPGVRALYLDARGLLEFLVERRP